MSTELELADEDEKIPYAPPPSDPAPRRPKFSALTRRNRYKIGDAFFHVKLEQAQEMLEAASERIDGEVSKFEDELASVREEMRLLKVDLYARFGKSINLEK